MKDWNDLLDEAERNALGAGPNSFERGMTSMEARDFFSPWKDVTSYSRSEDQRVPRTHEVQVGDCRLGVTRKRNLEGWYIYCLGPIQFESFADYPTMEAAQTAAVENLRKILKDTLEALQEAVR